jgi:Spy/CpxP family protein refolding chaperone
VSLRNVSLALLAICLSLPAFGQKTPVSNAPPANATTPTYHPSEMPMWGMWGMGGMASDNQIDRSLDTLQRTLNLSGSQVTSIRHLAQTRRDSLRAIREQARPKFEQLMALLKQPNPDPTAVGRIVVDLKGVHEQARVKQMDLEKQFTSLLNPTQRQTVENLRKEAPTFAALRGLGVLGAPDFAHGMFMDRQSERGDSTE